ncbi:MAG: R3H domain-containing nucleic acid-binding protein [Ornithinibacter sp.]
MTEHLTEDTAVSQRTTEMPETDILDSESDPGMDEAPEEATAFADAPGEDAGSTARPANAGSRRQHLEREGEVAADFLESLLDICDLDGDIDVDIEGDRAAISVVDSEDGRVPRRLVGQDGVVLEALQEITRLAVQSATGERSRLMLDVAGHRAERRRVLVEIATKAIAEVNETGERHAMDPMTAFERKVVHDEVLAAGLVSESEGSEPRRYVVILPA